MIYRKLERLVSKWARNKHVREGNNDFLDGPHRKIKNEGKETLGKPKAS